MVSSLRLLGQTLMPLAVWFLLLGPAAAAGLPVSASILPLGDFCKNLGGDRVEVHVLIPPGASPHVFEPSPSSAAQAMESRVLVYVGAGLDPWMERLVQLRSSNSLLVVEAVQGIPLITEVAHHHDDHKKPHETGHLQPATPEKKKETTPAEHTHEQGNPHVWLDPVLAQDICRRITKAFIQADPEHRKHYEGRLNAYLGKLEILHQDIIKKVSTFRRQEYVAFHPAFAYFARRYGLREVGVIEAAPGREPSPRHLQKIIAAVKNTGIKAVFAEPQLSARVAQVIAQEAGVKVLFLDPLGGRPPYGNDYLKLMRHNVAVFAQALE